MSKKNRLQNPLKSKSIPAELAKQLTTETAIAAIVTAIVSGEAGIKVRVANDLPPETLQAALRAMRLEIALNHRATLVLPLSDLPLAGIGVKP